MQTVVYNKKEIEMSKKISSKITIPLLGLIVTITVMLFGNNLVGRYLNNSNEEQKEKETSSKNEKFEDEDKYRVDTISVLVQDEKLPDLLKVPILDKGLYIENYYSEFHFGGINLDLVKFNVMSNKAEVLKIEFDEEKNIFKIPVFKDPQLEFSYKNKKYLISIINKKIQSFYYSIYEISNSKMELSKSKSEFEKK